MGNTNWINHQEYPFASHYLEVCEGRMRAVRLRSVGHFVQEEAPDELASAVVPFLKETMPA